MQSGELYDSGVAKHTLFEVTDIRKVMKGNAFSVCARQDRVFFGAGCAADYGIFQYRPRGVYDVVSARPSGVIWRFFVTDE